MSHDYDTTRKSWNVATRNHNAHKGDQAAFFRSGQETLFPEELELLGPLTGLSLLHLQCNAGQDSLSLARRGAAVVGVDFSDEAIAFARALSKETEIAAEFVQAEVVTFLGQTESRFDVAFCSYGAAGWLPDLGPWAQGIARVLKPGGRFVYVEFHPLVWSVGPSGALDGDDYFETERFEAPVGDYVAASGEGLGAVDLAPPQQNTITAHSWQHGVGTVVTSLAQAGLRIDLLRDYPYANGCKVHPTLKLAEGRRYHWPDDRARLPLMYAVVATRP